MEQYISNPNLPNINPDFKGNKFVDGQFSSYPWPDTDASFGNVLKWFVSPNPQKKEKKNDDFRLVVLKNESIFSTKEDSITWLGHSSFFIRLGGKNILFDPVLYKLPFMRRYSEIPCSVESIKNIDYLLLSHGHRDHFDEPSLKKIFNQNPKVKVLAPLKLSKLVNAVNENIEVEEAGWFQTFTIKDTIKITFLPALHWNRRGANDFNEMLWGSFLLETGNHKIFYAGDTAYGDHFKEIQRIVGNPTICLMPIGAYKPTFMMKASHMNPEEAIQAFKDLGGKKFIPMHYGTFDLSDEPLGEPIRTIREKLKKEYLIAPAVGEIILI
jgi:L-ascorbate metabolism protein UlaG (beta-lactamase superfamily)